MSKVLKNKITIITLIISIILLIFFTSIVYSAFSSTINITGIGYSRVEADVRITDFSMYATEENVISSYEEFSKDTITSNISLQNDTSSITYKIEITNYGINSVGILDIKGLPSELTYELIDYNLNDKLCDENNKCNNYAIKTFYIKITGTEGTYDLNLLFEFQPYIMVTYTNITNNNYPSEVIYNGDLSIDIGIDNAPGVLVSQGGILTENYKYKNGILTIENITDNINIEGFSMIQPFSYTGSEQLYTIPYSGIYKIELWGASSIYAGEGRGAYTSGNIQINNDENIYLYIGGAGKNNNSTSGGYNGGGSARKSSRNTTGVTGGGATDIRYFSTTPTSSDLTWNSTLGLNSRIMVAAGAGGGTSAGGVKGYTAYNETSTYAAFLGKGGTQTAGGSAPTQHTCAVSNGTAGGFGAGGTGGASGGSGLEQGGGAGGGAGYYGGSGASGLCNGNFVAGSGSSFISGHNGCVAITSSSSRTPRNNSSGSKCANGTTDIVCSYHYSNLIFTDTLMVDGLGYKWTTTKGSQTGMPTHDGTSTMEGNEGNGYAKITLIEMIKE